MASIVRVKCEHWMCPRSECCNREVELKEDKGEGTRRVRCNMPHNFLDRVITGGYEGAIDFDKTSLMGVKYFFEYRS